MVTSVRPTPLFAPPASAADPGIHCGVKLRIAAISYLNPAPLMWDFEHAPRQSELATRYEINWSTPAVCAARLASGEAEIGLVPIASYAATPHLQVIPNLVIASRNMVRSILLVTRAHQALHQIKSVALDTSSRSSATYLRILFERFWQARPNYVPHAPDLDAMLTKADAALLIGDPALVAIEQQQQREARTSERLVYLDIAEQWHKLTGTSWVAAFWALNKTALDESQISATRLIDDFTASREAGLTHIDELAREWSPRIGLTEAVIRSYLTENIWYHLDQDCRAGMELFYRYGAECGALPAAPKIQFLG